MTEHCLFGELPEQIGVKREAGIGAVRLWEPEREAIELRAMCLDSLIGADHPARLIWAYVLRVDLRELEKLIKAREGVAGHPAITPRLLLGLWLYATSEGVVSARLLARLCERDDVYRWFCGGVGVNHRTLSEFRVDHRSLLNRLLAQSVTALAAEGLIDLDMLAQDGVRVRASAGAASFRRRARLEQRITEVTAILAELAKEVESDPTQNEQRVRQRRTQRAAERLSRLEAAVAKVAEIEAQQPKSKPKESTPQAAPPDDGEPPGTKDAKRPKEPRASTTDPEARVVKMADGGFRPAYNMQVASVAGEQIVVAVEVSTSSSDRGLARPMIEKIEATYGELPNQHLVDGGYSKNDDIEWRTGSMSQCFARRSSISTTLTRSRRARTMGRASARGAKGCRARPARPPIACARSMNASMPGSGSGDWCNSPCAAAPRRSSSSPGTPWQTTFSKASG